MILYFLAKIKPVKKTHYLSRAVEISYFIIGLEWIEPFKNFKKYVSVYKDKIYFLI